MCPRTQQDPAGGPFGGIPEDAVAFYAELVADNSRTWWLEHKARYDANVREPVAHLGEVLAEEFGEPSLFRPHRDVRFSKDKRPYKEHQGAFVKTAETSGWYVQISADGLTTAAGIYAATPDQVARLRAAVDADRTGRSLERIAGALRDNGFEIGGERIKTRPRGIPEDHPRLELLRHKTLTAARDHGVPAWLTTPACADKVREDWRAMRPLVEWLDEHVGPPEAGARRR